MSAGDLDLDLLAPEISALARRASEAILEIYATDFAVESKVDHSPVTAADTAAEAIITQGLRTITPDVPVVAEEAAAAGCIPDVSAGVFWLVDPLDGTREFLSRNGQFTVNIGLVEDGKPVLGIIHIPTLNETFVGSLRSGATRTQGNEAPQPIRVRDVPAEGLTVIASRRHGDPAKFEQFLEGRTIADQKTAGSSMKFCAIAMGEADAYPRYGRTMEWDTAAGHAILTASGGRVLTVEDAPLSYGKPNFENPAFIAWGGGL